MHLCNNPRLFASTGLVCNITLPRVFSLQTVHFPFLPALLALVHFIIANNNECADSTLGHLLTSSVKETSTLLLHLVSDKFLGHGQKAARFIAKASQDWPLISCYYISCFFRPLLSWPPPSPVSVWLSSSLLLEQLLKLGLQYSTVFLSQVSRLPGSFKKKHRGQALPSDSSLPRTNFCLSVFSVAVVKPHDQLTETGL